MLKFFLYNFQHVSDRKANTSGNGISIQYTTQYFWCKKVSENIFGISMPQSPNGKSESFTYPFISSDGYCTNQDLPSVKVILSG